MKSVFYDILFVFITYVIVVVCAIATVSFAAITFPCRLVITTCVGFRQFKSFPAYLVSLPEAVWGPYLGLSLGFGLVTCFVGGLLASTSLLFLGFGFASASVSMLFLRLWYLTRL